jgi:hypothetical protein
VEKKNSPYRILVFPCGSEIGLEVNASLQYNKEFELIGASSVSDHGQFVYDSYIGDVPQITASTCIEHIRKIVESEKIDLIYPTMDAVLYELKKNEKNLGVPVITSSLQTTEICLSKSKTYHFLNHIVPTPKVYNKNENICDFPLFVKPDIGYGSRGTARINNSKDLAHFIEQNSEVDYLMLEYLTGSEYTIDCLTDHNGQLLFVGARERGRISNGISVSSKTSCSLTKEFKPFATAINQRMSFRGAWFFQMKRNNHGAPVLLEVACRLAGSSSVHRIQGINFAALSCYVALEKSVSILQQNFNVKIDRALSRRFKFDVEFTHVYIDLDDTIIVNEQINAELMSFLFRCRNQKKSIILITKHRHNLDETLSIYCIKQIFDKIIHIEPHDHKWRYMNETNSIFIDDSFAERKSVFEQLKIPVFSPESII